MPDCMTFPDTVEEFMEKYKVVDTDGVYMSKGSELVPIFRMMQWFEQLPSAQPEPSMEECACCVLSKPERKKGKWIEHNPHTWGLGIVFECSECGEKIDCEPSNFCPNCGAEMEGQDGM